MWYALRMKTFCFAVVPRVVALACLCVGLLVAPRVCAQDVPAGQGEKAGDETVLKDAVVIDPVSSSGRVLLFSDAVEALRVAGKWETPKAGDAITMPDGSKKEWKNASAGDDGWLPLRGGGYAVWRVESTEERVMLLDAVGHGSVLVNGELRTGDPYENGYVKLPVLLKKGENELLFKGGRGRVRAKLSTPPAEVYVSNEDATLPDLLAGDWGQYGAVMLVNASRETLRMVGITTELPGDDKPVALDLEAGELSPLVGEFPRISVPPLSIRKIPMRFGKVPMQAPQGAGAAAAAPAAAADAPFVPFDLTVRLSISASRENAAAVSLAHELKLPVRSPGAHHKRTFISGIDGSVQYYSVVPATKVSETAPPGVVLSLHGASVEATNQAGAYAQKDWCHIVCPTNRRPFGFDWEDWGRTDALEVLSDATSELYPVDRKRTYLTGHSMGGHGTWQLGAHFPDLFAAIAPSAGWSSFGSYGGGPPNVYEKGTAPQQMLRRASSASDTLALARNYAMEGVYILHGDADDNVPVTQARAMKKMLAEFHTDFAYYEQPGAGHWWGNECVDWPPIFEFFKRHALTDEYVRRSPIEARRKRIEFVTASPSVSSSCDWVSIIQQVRRMAPSKIDISCDIAKKRYTAKTENIETFVIEYDALLDVKDTFSVEVDGTVLDGISFPRASKAHEGTVSIYREDGAWKWGGGYGRSSSVHPGRGGMFKRAFGNTVVLVYSTAGTPEENAWSLAKAKFDAETFWYRGNGSIAIMADTDYPAYAAHELDVPDRQESYPGCHHSNVVIYGNADTNAAWKVLLADSPVQVHRDRIIMSDRVTTGDNLAALFIRPMANDECASVGVITGTGLPGCRLTDRLPIFVSGVGIPDWVVLSTDMLTNVDQGLLGAGFFGNDWSLERGDSAWLNDAAAEKK